MREVTRNGKIVESVIRSVVPGIALGSYLEATPDLTLSKLRKILRSYFRESSATEFFQQLATITQSQNEDPQTFLMRALELRSENSVCVEGIRCFCQVR